MGSPSQLAARKTGVFAELMLAAKPPTKGQGGKPNEAEVFASRFGEGNGASAKP